MSYQKHILIFSRSYVESGMANVNQTLYMAQALGDLTQVEVNMRTYNPTMSYKIVEKIIGQDLSFNFKGKNLPAIFFTIRFCIGLIFKSRTKNIVYTRSLVVSLISQTLGFQSGVELHQDRLSTSYFLNQFCSPPISFTQHLIRRNSRLDNAYFLLLIVQ